jgi:HlyD family secretion protein
MRLRAATKLILSLLLPALGVAGFVLLKATRPNAEPSPAEERAWRVEVAPVQPGRHAPALRLYGRVESPRAARLTAAVSAEVLSVPVREGEDVEADAPLVALDPRDAELVLTQRHADVAELEASIRSEEAQYRADRESLAHEEELLALSRDAVQRAESLTQRKLGSESVLDEARSAQARQALALTSRRLALSNHPARLAQLQARLARAKAQVGLAELDLARTRIAAPFAGRVARTLVSEGDRVRVGDGLVELYDTGALEVRAQIPEDQVGRLRRALADSGALGARAVLDGAPLRLRLSRLSGRVEPKGGGLDGLFVLEGAESAPRLGRFLELTLELPPVDGVVPLPGSGLYGTDRVYEVVDGRLAGRRVQRVGISYGPEGTRYLVRSPELGAGDQVLVTQLANAVDGLKVEPVQTPAP